MQLTVLFVCLAVIGLAPTAHAQGKDSLPPDPLLQHTREVLRACFEKGMIGIRPFVRDIKDEQIDSPRLKELREFAESCRAIFEAWQKPNGDPLLRTFMNPDKLMVTRPDTKALEVLVRHEVPEEVEMKSPEGKRVHRIIWTFKYVREGDKFLLESITKTFVTTPANRPGFDYMSGMMDICKERVSCAISFLGPKTAWYPRLDFCLV